MGSRRDRKKMNVAGDRLSNLPDDLIHKILSFIGTKHAIQTSVLSSRWRYIWTSMPYLSFSSKDFGTIPRFSNFVKRVLSGRNNQIEVFSVELRLRGKFSRSFVKSILNYAFSHNVQQLNIPCVPGEEIGFPLSLISSQSLKHLTLTGLTRGGHFTMTPPTWELPSLATLNLYRVTLYGDKGAGLFSNCANLKNLTLRNCRLKGSNRFSIRRPGLRLKGGCKGFNICHPGLSSLTLEGGCKGFNVDTPQLNNLTINNCRRIHLISAPNLSALHYTIPYYFCYDYNDRDDDDDVVDNDGLLQLSTDLFHLEKVEVYIQSPKGGKKYTRKIVGLLEQLRSVKFLTFKLGTCQASFFIRGTNLTSTFSICQLKEFKDLYN